MRSTSTLPRHPEMDDPLQPRLYRVAAPCGVISPDELSMNGQVRRRREPAPSGALTRNRATEPLVACSTARAGAASQ